MPTAITLSSVSKVFGSGATAVRVVEPMSLEIAAGEMFFLLGPSGCGKTTLLRIIAGFIEPTGGRVLFNGKDVTDLPPNRRHTGMVFQSYALWPHMTVAENVAFGLDLRHVPRTEREARVREALEQVHMAPFAARKPVELSGGQQQRAALARALVIRPDVLLLDEPLSNLDAKLRIELRSEIRRICKAAEITAVYVTHDQKEALSMADRIAVLRSGRIEQIGTPQDLYCRPASSYVASFLGATNLVAGAVRDQGLVDSALGPIQCDTSKFAEGTQVLCSIRPESISFREPQNRVEAQVTSRVYLGEVWEIGIRHGQTNLMMWHPVSESVPDEGAALSVGFAQRDVAVLPG